MWKEILVIFVLVLLVLLLVMYISKKPKPAEKFWMETPPKYKRCNRGAYGRPLSFEYDLAEIPEKCNPF